MKIAFSTLIKFLVGLLLVGALLFFFSGFETRIYSIDGDNVNIDIEPFLILKPSKLGDIEIEK